MPRITPARLDSPPRRPILQQTSIRAALVATAAGFVVLLVWPRTALAGPTAGRSMTSLAMAGLNIGVLVFREGLECILVLAAVTASMAGGRHSYRRPVALGAAIAFAATVATWVVAVRLVDDLTESVPALQIQAATGLLAICVLLVVMNWFFHKVYWTGWISRHSNKKRQLLKGALEQTTSRRRVLLGLALLGFTSLYREGFEVVLFLQSYRLRLGPAAVASGVLVGLLLTGMVAALTFVAHRRLPYRKMLVVTGVLLGVVLLVMVGEQAQEMQLARWLPTTEIHWLDHLVPSWMRLWFSIFPTIETLIAQVIALLLVLGSYLVARFHLIRTAGLGSSGRLA